MSEREWYRRWKKYKKDFKPTKRKLSQSIADFSKSENPLAGPVISVLISLYKSDEYLDSFLSALQNQSIKKSTEFIFILVQPSKNTIAKVNAFAGSVQYVQIQYYDSRIGIYEAWNHGIRAATTEFLTNWNADDVRAPDSLEIQYLYLSTHPEVDVVYQDLYYSLEPNVPWEVLEAIGMQSNLPNVTAQYLIETKMNPPHNAPAWRRSLHEEFGFFDESYLSAGDYEFWVRLSLKDRSFFKVEKPHVAYFINPKGFSTIPGNPGLLESNKIIEFYRPVLLKKTLEAQG